MHLEERALMGHIQERDRSQLQMLSLDEMVDPKSIARVIDRFIEIVDFENLGFVNTTPKALGRNSFSPKTMAKIYVFGYIEGIRSSRKLEKACKVNIEMMWLVGGLRPDYKTIADFRRDNTEALSGLFYEFTSFADSAGLYGKKLVAIDGTKIKASNSKKRNVSKKAAKRRLEHFKRDAQDYIEALETEDDVDAIADLSNKLDQTEKRIEYNAELLASMDEEDAGEISLSDKDARCMGHGRGGTFVAYNVQAAVDDKHHMVADIDVTNRADDHGQLSNMALRTQEVLRKCDICFLADKGYWSGDDITTCKDAGMDFIVAPQGKSHSKTGSAYSTEKFHYDKKTDTYICPAACILECTSKPDAKIRLYANPMACRDCDAQDRCASSGLSYRRLRKDAQSDVLDWARAQYGQNKEIYKKRQQIVEHVFGTIKRSMDSGYFLLRGFAKVKCEAALTFTAYNIKRALSTLGYDEMMAKLDEYAALIGRFFVFKGAKGVRLRLAEVLLWVLEATFMAGRIKHQAALLRAVRV
jgi:transposase